MTKELDTDRHIIEALTAICDSRLVQMPAPMALPAFYENKPERPYSTVRFKGTVEFLLVGVRIGGRGQIIAKLQPMDTADYTHVEVDGAKLHQFGLEQAFVSALGTYLADMQRVSESEDLDAPFIATNASLASAMTIFREAMPALLLALEEIRATLAHRAQADAYADNPAWGSW